MEPIADPRAVAEWWAESERGAAEREAAAGVAHLGWEPVAAMALTAYGGVLGIGVVFGLIFTATAFRDWPSHASEVPYFALWDVLAVVGAWLAFDLADSVGFDGSIEWAPTSPP